MSTEFTLRPFASLGDQALERIAALHHEVMHNLLTDLGRPLILRYYQTARSDPSVIGFCAFSSSQEVLGWVVGSPDPFAVNRRLRKPFFWFLQRMLLLILCHPSAFFQMVFSVLHSSQQRLAIHTIELTYIGVAPEAQAQGIGRSLLNAFLKASRSAGYLSVELTTETDNRHALGLYRKSGFAVKNASREGRFERYRMERKLLP